MARAHKFYLSLGSNISPERHLVEAIARLRRFGKLEAVSGVWESRAEGTEGPNYLNVCVCLQASLTEADLRQEIIHRIENELGRTRTSDKNAPRTIDIDLVMVDDEPLDLERWNHAYVLMPMSELLPDLAHPTSKQPLANLAGQVKLSTWIQRLPGGLPESTTLPSN